jgi:hypothetical protein
MFSKENQLGTYVVSKWVQHLAIRFYEVSYKNGCCFPTKFSLPLGLGKKKISIRNKFSRRSLRNLLKNYVGTQVLYLLLMFSKENQLGTYVVSKWVQHLAIRYYEVPYKNGYCFPTKFSLPLRLGKKKFHS